MRKVYSIILVLLFYIMSNAQTQKIILIGGSSAESTNGWFELGCDKLTVPYTNKAVAGESIGDAANKMFAGTLYTKAELESMTALVLMYNQNVNVFDPSLTKENYTDYTMPFNSLTDNVIAFDYILKKYTSDCYNLKNDPISTSYQKQYGKPAVIILCTNWHDGTAIYNNSIRLLSAKWGLKLVEFDKYIGFSSASVHPVTKQQYSLLYASDTIAINGVEYGLNPNKGVYSFIQGKMAKIFKSTLESILP